MKRVDIAVIGGGAAGLAAAISAKRTNGKASVAVIERLPKVGKKILATGNGRCNLSNADLSEDHYHGTNRDLAMITSGFSVTDFFAGLGVLCEDDGYGRIYPRCRSAASVLDALRLECARLGVEEVCGYEVTDINVGKRSFVIHSADREITAVSVILAGGGKSQPALGSNGSLLDICAGLGIRIAEPFPALVPLKTDPALVKPLKGQRADAKVTICADGTPIKTERGEVQFTDGLISGICVFDLSYLYDRCKHNCKLRLDLLPDMSIKQVTDLLYSTRDIRKAAPAEDYLSGIFTKPMGLYLLKRTYNKLPEKTDDIKEPEQLAGTIKSLTFPITGTAGFDRSQVTAGGIAAPQICDNFELENLPGMYACGEMIDIFGDCGGYNLDFAFSSGAIAGRSAASGLYKRQ